MVHTPPTTSSPLHSFTGVKVKKKKKKEEDRNTVSKEVFKLTSRLMSLPSPSSIGEIGHHCAGNQQEPIRAIHSNHYWDRKFPLPLPHSSSPLPPPPSLLSPPSSSPYFSLLLPFQLNNNTNQASARAAWAWAWRLMGRMLGSTQRSPLSNARHQREPDG